MPRMTVATDYARPPNKHLISGRWRRDFERCKKWIYSGSLGAKVERDLLAAAAARLLGCHSAERTRFLMATTRSQNIIGKLLP